MKMFRFKEFLHGIEFVQKVAEIAEANDHHPDITINYTRVTFSCSTHDAGGVTEKDFKLADNIEIAFKDHSRVNARRQLSLAVRFARKGRSLSSQRAASREPSMMSM